MQLSERDEGRTAQVRAAVCGLYQTPKKEDKFCEFLTIGSDAWESFDSRTDQDKNILLLSPQNKPKINLEMVSMTALKLLKKKKDCGKNIGLWFVPKSIEKRPILRISNDLIGHIRKFCLKDRSGQTYLIIRSPQ